MTPVQILVVVAGVLAVVDLVDSRGRSATSWGVLVLAIALLWGNLNA